MYDREKEISEVGDISSSEVAMIRQSLRAEIATLTRERDEALAALRMAEESFDECIQGREFVAIAAQAELLRGEYDRLREQFAAMMFDNGRRPGDGGRDPARLAHARRQLAQVEARDPDLTDVATALRWLLVEGKG